MLCMEVISWDGVDMAINHKWNLHWRLVPIIKLHYSSSIHCPIMSNSFWYLARIAFLVLDVFYNTLILQLSFPAVLSSMILVSMVFFFTMTPCFQQMHQCGSTLMRFPPLAIRTVLLCTWYTNQYRSHSSLRRKGEREREREREREVVEWESERGFIVCQLRLLRCQCLVLFFSSTTIHVDFSQPCRVVRNILCRRYGVRHHYEYGLQYEGTGK